MNVYNVIDVLYDYDEIQRNGTNTEWMNISQKLNIEHHIVILMESQNGNIMNKQQNRWQMTMWHEKHKHEFNDEVKVRYDIHHLPIFMLISDIRAFNILYLSAHNENGNIIIIISQFHLSVDWLR